MVGPKITSASSKCKTKQNTRSKIQQIEAVSLRLRNTMAVARLLTTRNCKYTLIHKVQRWPRARLATLPEVNKMMRKQVELISVIRHQRSIFTLLHNRGSLWPPIQVQTHWKLHNSTKKILAHQTCKTNRIACRRWWCTVQRTDHRFRPPIKKKATYYLVSIQVAQQLTLLCETIVVS